MLGYKEDSKIDVQFFVDILVFFKPELKRVFFMIFFLIFVITHNLSVAPINKGYYDFLKPNLTILIKFVHV